MDNYQEMVELQINNLVSSLEDKSFEAFKALLMEKSLCKMEMVIIKN